MLSGFIHVSNILSDSNIRWVYDNDVLRNNDSTQILNSGKEIIIEIIKINQLKLEITAKVNLIK